MGHGPALELAELLPVDVSSLSLRDQAEPQAALERARNKLDAALLAQMRDRFAEDEAMLVTTATEVNADQLVKVVDRWIRLHDQDGAEPHAPDHDTVNANRVGDRVKITPTWVWRTGSRCWRR